MVWEKWKREKNGKNLENSKSNLQIFQKVFIFLLLEKNKASYLPEEEDAEADEEDAEADEEDAADVSIRFVVMESSGNSSHT